MGVDQQLDSVQSQPESDHEEIEELPDPVGSTDEAVAEAIEEVEPL
jgi:hypothetical protein